MDVRRGEWWVPIHLDNIQPFESDKEGFLRGAMSLWWHTLWYIPHVHPTTPVRLWGGTSLIYFLYWPTSVPAISQRPNHDPDTSARDYKYVCSRPIIGYRWRTIVSISPFFPLGQTCGTWKEPNYNPCWEGWTRARRFQLFILFKLAMEPNCETVTRCCD